MFKIFVKPYADEILYSQLARLFFYTMEFSSSKFMFELYGRSSVKAILDLPNNLFALNERYYHFSKLTLNQIIDQYTLYPYYSHFLKEIKKDQILQLMKQGSARTIQLRSGINGSTLSPVKFPRYCPVCIQESIEQNQEPYWKRIHQITGVIVCPIHNVFLKSYTPSLSDYGKHIYVNANKIRNSELLICENKNPLLKSLSIAHANLLQNKYDFKIELADYYKALENSCFHVGNKLSISSLQTEIKKYFGEEILSAYFGVNRIGNLQWVKDFIYSPRNYFDPIKHILLDYFLKNYNLKKLLFKQSEWEGPWKCINHACQNFDESVSTSYTIHFNTKLKKSYALVSCKCGMNYKVFYSSSRGVLKQTKKICVYGEAWEKYVLSKLNQGIGIKSISKMLKCHISVVKKFLIISGEFNNRSMDLERQNRIVQFRRKLFELIEKKGNDNSVELRDLDKEVYDFLVLFDCDWLNLINKNISDDFNNYKLKLKWDLIDQEVLNLVFSIINDLKQKGFKGRITKGLLSKLLNRGVSYFEHYSHRLPRTVKLIENSIETLYDYRIRRINEALVELKSSNDSITTLKVIRKAGITKLKDDSIISYAESLTRNIKYG